MQHDLRTRVSNRDLRHALKRSSDDLGLLRLLNLGPGLNGWWYQVSSDLDGLNVRVVFPNANVTPSLSELLSGVNPELFNCSSIEYSRESSRFEVGRVREWLLSDDYSTELKQVALESDYSPPNYVQINGCFTAGLPSALTDGVALSHYLTARTWLGSPRYSVGSKVANIAVLAHERELRASDLTVTSGDPIAHLKASVASARLWSLEAKRFSFRHSDFGEIEIPGLLREEVCRLLRRRGLRGGILEFDHSLAFEPAVLGGVEPSGEFLDAQRILVEAIEKSAQLEMFAKESRQEKRLRAMVRLNRRVEAARKSPEVRMDGRFVGLAPKSESGAIAIFHKLEGMNLLPFPYVSRAWAGGEGIDELADFQLSDLQLMQTDSPVEFEYEFENFFAHDHPLEQVKLIVCWRARSLSLLENTESEFIKIHRWSKGEIPVVLISRLPGLTIQGEQ